MSVDRIRGKKGGFVWNESEQLWLQSVCVDMSTYGGAERHAPRELLNIPFELHERFDREWDDPSLHNVDHLRSFIYIGISYLENSTDTNDPLGARADLLVWNDKHGTDISYDQFVTAFCIAGAFHDVCEIAEDVSAGNGAGPVISPREDGLYRGYRSISVKGREGRISYKIPEKLSAEAAKLHIEKQYADDPGLREAYNVLVPHLIMETQYLPPEIPTPFSCLMRMADRMSGFVNPDSGKDIGKIMELYKSDVEAQIIPRNEFNFPQTQASKVLPKSVTIDQVLRIVFDGYYPPMLLNENQNYSNQRDLILASKFLCMEGYIPSSPDIDV